MNRPYRVLDLFCGAAGGWSLGLHRAGGFTTVAACEIDPWRREQFSKNFPEARLYDDVRTLTADRLWADGAFPNIIVGSPPCQDASTANANGKGIDGARTGLFMEWVRLVAECRPRWACAENVPGIRSRGIDRVLGKLEAIDYAFWPLVVGASDLGANHLRKRLVLVAHPDRQGQHAGAGDAREVAWRTSDARHAANPARIGRDTWTRPDIAFPEHKIGVGHHWSATAPDFGGMDAWFSQALADFCRLKCGEQGCHSPESLTHRSSAITVADHSRGADLEDGLKIGAAFSLDASAHSHAPTALLSQEKRPFDGAPNSCEEIAAKSATQQKISMPIMPMETLRTTTRRISRPSADHVICAITGRRVKQACSSLGAQSAEFNRLVRACIAAYGDSFAPQKAELIGRAILSLEAA